MSPSVAMRPVAGALGRSRALPRRQLVAKSLAVAFVRHYGSPTDGGLYSQRQMLNRMLGQSKNGQKEMRLSEGQKEAQARVFKNGAGPLSPGTFVALPLSQYPKNPITFARYTWSRLHTWGLETAALLRFKMQSMPGWTSRPLWKAQRGKIAPTAKALYREVLEAFAAGDKATLDRLCLPQFASQLGSAIGRRNRGEETVFELVKYRKPLTSPRLASYLITPLPFEGSNGYREQAVVAIASTQKVYKRDAKTGQTIGGTLKLQDKTEYVVLAREVNGETFQSGAWRVWGTTHTTTLDRHLWEMDKVKQDMAQYVGMKLKSK